MGRRFLQLTGVFVAVAGAVVSVAARIVFGNITNELATDQVLPSVRFTFSACFVV